MTRSLSRPVLGVVVAVLLLLLLVPAAAAAPKRITGKLNKGGYTVIAVAANGKAKAVRAAKGGRFGLRPPATRVTLHLRAPNGRYGGPIVVGRKKKGKVAILGVRAGAKLGRIKVSARAGYARVAKKLRKKRWADTTRRARARKGVPIGAAVFGRVRSRGVRTVVPGDQDLDGIPGPLDIDDDGDLVLDGLDRVTGPRAAQTPMGEFQITSLLAIPLYDTANANAAGSTDQQVETALRDWGRLNYVILPGDSAELDCQGLIYCSPGGTGRIWAGMTYASATPFPVPCCDADGDGFGTLKAPGSFPGMTLYHGATTGQSGSGDLLIQRVTTGGVETQFPATLPFLFATVPALVSYDDEAGNARTISYPVLGPGDPGGPGPGTHGNELPITDGPDADSDVELTMTFWRPQRRPIPPETGTWIDIGALRYTTSIFAHPPGGVATAAVGCPQSAFTETDPQLGPAPPSPSTTSGGVVDLVGDRPASPANTFTYTLNVTQCLAASGLSFDSGSRLDLTSLAATNSNGAAEQGLSFKRP